MAGKLLDRPDKPKPIVDSHLQRNFSCILGEAGDMDSEWVVLKAPIADVEELW